VGIGKPNEGLTVLTVYIMDSVFLKSIWHYRLLKTTKAVRNRQPLHSFLRKRLVPSVPKEPKQHKEKINEIKVKI
jgi:hypothetical protein